MRMKNRRWHSCRRWQWLNRSSLVFLWESEKKITFKAVPDGQTGVIVDKYSPQKFLQSYWYSDTRSGRGGRKFLALQGLIRQSRRSIGGPGVSGAQSAVPAIQMPRALRPVQSLIRVPSDEAFTSRSNVFSNLEEMTERRKRCFFGLYVRKLSKQLCMRTV